VSDFTVVKDVRYLTEVVYVKSRKQVLRHSFLAHLAEPCDRWVQTHGTVG